MKLSLNWLKTLVDFVELDPYIIAENLSDSAAEIEEIHIQSKGLENIFVGEIKEITAHPNADKMRVTQTQVGDTCYTIVCGASNIQVGLKVPVALVGAILPGDFCIKKTDKRGVESCGMICSESELGLTESSEGIMELPQDAPNGESIIQYLALDDIVFEIENTTITNRPDLFSHIGFARECIALGLAQEKKDINIYEPENIKKAVNNQDFFLDIQCKSKDLLFKICGAEIQNFKVQPSPLWMQKRLQSCGIRSINNLVDITNYVMLEVGMPLHAFDVASIQGTNIQLRASKKGEKITTLDGKERTLPEGVIILEDEEKIFDLCGIMGGENSEIQNTSNHIWLHAPVYDPIRIRRASIALNHRTDASVIYEKRVPTSSAYLGLQKALELIKQLSPDVKIQTSLLDIFHDNEIKRSISLSIHKVHRILGEILPTEKICSILKSLGFIIDKQEQETLEVVIPHFRFKDIEIEEDIIEEIVRIYGLKNIQAEFPLASMHFAQPSQSFVIEKKIKDILSVYAYETLHYSFLGKDLLDKTEQNDLSDVIEIQNPMGEDHRYMRTSLLPCLLKSTEENAKHDDHFSLYELGKVFRKNITDKTNTRPIQEIKELACISYHSDFYALQSTLFLLAKKLGITLQIRETKELASYYHPGRSAAIYFQGKNIGFIGHIHPQVTKNFDIKHDVVYFEMNIETMIQRTLPIKKYKVMNKYPSIYRDQNFILDSKVLVGPFIQKIQKGIKNLVNIEIQDIYEGEHIDQEKKCLTLRVTYRLETGTLKDSEADIFHKQLVDKALQNNAELR
jgi:phenylalanyl-tRNA synthetase beta chain